jgi:hypothetical protein
MIFLLKIEKIEKNKKNQKKKNRKKTGNKLLLKKGLLTQGNENRKKMN